MQVANPNSSGTSYTMLATLVQLMGEDKAFDYLKALHKNVNQYTKSGAAPARAAATGESLVGITFQHDAVVQAVDGAPVAIVSPCEGTGYEIGSMSIIKGAKNMDNAKKWYDWALSPEAQAVGSQAKVSYQVPSNKSGAGAGAGAQARRDQAHRLRLREVRLVGRAQAPAGQVGQGGLDAAEVSAPRHGHRRARAGCFRAGRARSCDGGGRCCCTGGAGRAALGAGGRDLGAVARRRRRRWRLLAAARRGGVAALLFAWRGARPLRPRSPPAPRCWGVHRRLRGRPPGHRPSASAPASRCSRCTVVLRARHRPPRRASRATRSWPTIVVVIAGLLMLFVFFPVGKVLIAALFDAKGTFAPALAAQRLFTADIWGLACFTGGTRCGVAINSAVLATIVGIGSTLIGLVLALVAQRGGQRYSGVTQLMSILPIITPPFVIALALVVLFGRTGVVTGWLDGLVRHPALALDLRPAGRAHRAAADLLARSPS